MSICSLEVKIAGMVFGIVQIEQRFLATFCYQCTMEEITSFYPTRLKKELNGLIKISMKVLYSM